MLAPVAFLNEPDPIFGKLPVNATFAVPLLSKYCGVGKNTSDTLT